MKLKKDNRIDEYIGNAAPFAKPVLRHLRSLVHSACPEVEETIKWNFPNFLYNGSILCSMAAFKQHCSFGFWLALQMEDPNALFVSAEAAKDGMGHLGKINAIDDLPGDKILIKYIRQAASLIESGVRMKKVVKKTTAVIPDIPVELAAAFKRKKTAAATFEKLPPSHRKEYLIWILEAKTEATRIKRVTKAIEQLSIRKSIAGKSKETNKEG